MFGAMVTVKNIWTKTRVTVVLRAIIAKNTLWSSGQKFCADFGKKSLEIWQRGTRKKSFPHCRGFQLPNVVSEVTYPTNWRDILSIKLRMRKRPLSF